MEYGLLRQQNPAYHAKRWEELGDLYVGGYDLAEKAARYMPRFLGETAERYAERIAAASYINYFSAIADYFVAHLFSQELTVSQAPDANDASTPGTAPTQDGFYAAFAHDADLRGTSFQKLIRQLFTTAIVKGKGLLAIDLPTPAMRALSLADEEEVGAGRAYAFEVVPEELIDWEYDDSGRFAWAILHRTIQRRSSPADTRDKVVEEFKVWTQDGEVARWDLYRTKPRRPNDTIKDTEDIPRVDGGKTTFRRIPLLELTMPPGLWVGNKVGTLAREHYQRRSALNAAENKSLFAIPYVKLGPEVTAPGQAMPAEAQQNPRRGRDPRGQFNARGYVVLGKDDDLGFAEPEGKAYELVDRQLQHVVDEMYRIVHQMAQSVAATTRAPMARAAASKVEDRHATEIVLGAYGALVRDFAKRVYDTIAEARGEDVVWTPRGLDKFELEDRDGILQEALAIQAITIPSATFRKIYATKLAFALVGDVPPETQDTIREEVEDAVEHEGDLAFLLNEPANANAEEDPQGARSDRRRNARPGARKPPRASARREART